MIIMKKIVTPPPSHYHYSLLLLISHNYKEKSLPVCHILPKILRKKKVKENAVQAKRLSNFVVSPPRANLSPAMLSVNGVVVTDSPEYIDGVSGRAVSSLSCLVLIGKIESRERSSSEHGRCCCWCCSVPNRFRLGGVTVGLDLELENRQWW